jgi:hypothetical protein
MKAAHAVISGAAYGKSGFPGFPAHFVTSTDFNAAFLNESRTRGHFRCSVREIRVRALSNRRKPALGRLFGILAQRYTEPSVRFIQPVLGLFALDSQLLHDDRHPHRACLIQ